MRPIRILIILLWAGSHSPLVAADVHEYLYTVQPGDTLSGIALKFTGTACYRKTARHNGITTPDRIFPGDRIRVEASSPADALRRYLEAIYSGDPGGAYQLLSGESRARFPEVQFANALRNATRFDLATAAVCADFSWNGRHVVQVRISLEEDPATWGFNLVWENRGWRILLFDLYPAFPHYDGYLKWRCR